MSKLCVGIDISKDKFDVTYTVDNQTFFGYTVFTNESKGIKKFFKQAENFKKQKGCTEIHFCMEATGSYHYELCDFLQKSAYIISVANPSCTHSYAKSILLRTKNDRVDSKMLAQYTYANNPPQAPKIPEEIMNFRALVRYKNALIKDRTREIARFKSCHDYEVKKLIQKHLNSLEKHIKVVFDKINKKIESNKLLKENYDLLVTIPGVGYNIAWAILSEIDVTNIDTISPKGMVSYAGLSPKEHKSGSSVNGRNRISRIGSSSFRKVFFMPALGCIRGNNYFNVFYTHLVENGKPKKTAIVAVMRKILLTAGGVLKSGQPFDPNWSKKVQEKYQENLRVA